ncbi:MAG: Alcohol dehydrogenase zinc-binding domain protein [Gemmatimonadetes bacterium]|nr:Alcohol dehydrogenase zinc-binding domain protein [Gemmatimonadota bacterium]
MKQLLQQLDTGQSRIIDVPVPHAGPRGIVVESRATLISAGTERMLVEFGRANLLAKARAQPDRVKDVLAKVRTEGVSPTIDAVRAKLEAPLPLGYCQAGVVVEVGKGVTGFSLGDAVVTNGPHAEYVRVSHTLAARILGDVTFDAAAFTPLAAIGLQGIRLAAPTLGETVVVYGLGLIGLLTVQLLRANGCRVVGIDRDHARLTLARAFGAETIDGSAGPAANELRALTNGVGADAVLLTLASQSDEPMHDAAMMSRKRGRLVLVGVTGLALRREDFFRKELSFAVSCSYGPGRYDPSYEEQGLDYPLPYVRWTEQRNFEAVLRLMSQGLVDPAPLISHRFAFDDAPSAYDLISSAEPSLGIVLSYPDRKGVAPGAQSRIVQTSSRTTSVQSGTVAVIGAGNFATRTLIPALRSTSASLHTIVSSGGTSAAVAGSKFGFQHAASSLDPVFADKSIDTVFVLTRHNSHASLVIRALQAGKNVFVEKPLALTDMELDEVRVEAERAGTLLMVGFNRRFAPLAREAAELLGGRVGPLSIVVTVNAGAIPREHWTQDLEVGGGRIIGEACHFVDLCRFLVGQPIIAIEATPARDRSGAPVGDIVHLVLAFADGSTAAVHYMASGARSYPKERVECFWDGKTVSIDNWRRMERFGVKGSHWQLPRGMDKGHAAEISDWMGAVRGERPVPIPLAELIEVSRWSIHAAQAVHGER